MLKGYCSKEYRSVYGESLLYPREEGNLVLDGLLLKRSISNDLFDLSNVYPFFTNYNNCSLSDLYEKAKESQAVSLVLITDPLNPIYMDLSTGPDIQIDSFKLHYICNLKNYEFRKLPENHRRNINKSKKENLLVIPSIIEDVEKEAKSIFDIYQNLVTRHSIKGVTDYSVQQIEKLISVPGTFLFKVYDSVGHLINASIFYISGEIGNIYYHLSCQTEEGYKLNSNFLMMHTAIALFKQLGFNKLELGAGADGKSSEGLCRFKEGFSTETIKNLIIKIVLRQEIYNKLSENKNTAFFPAYRG